ncbi:MAG: 5'-3' exonuclease [Egibacteraceae bacterium]
MAYRLLLDTSSLTYRAFFALPTSITGLGGRPVNAVRGYLDMTASLVSDLRPDEVLHVFDDDWRPAPRVAAYPGYKSQRAPDPDGLGEQFDLLREVLDALGQPVVIAPGWEADDAIGALCAQLGDADRADIVTGDRDLIQLVRDGAVRVLFTLKGVKQLARYDEAGVLAKYGIPPARYADFATLRGDPSDGLPGVRGVGEKTAAALVTRYPSLDDLLADAPTQTPRLAAALRDAAAYLAAMRAVVPVRTDVGLVTSDSARDDARLDKLQAEHRLEGPIRRLREALDAP